MYDLFLYYHFIPLIEKIFFSAFRKTRQGIIANRKSFYATDRKLKKRIDFGQSRVSVSYRILYSIVSYLYVKFTGLIASVREERPDV